MSNNKIAISVDIEDWYNSPYVINSPFAKYASIDDFFKDWRGRFDYITDPTIRILKLFEKHDIKATFFIVAGIIEKYPEIIRALKNSNHEIACHGLHHESGIDSKTKKEKVTKLEWKSNLRKAKTMLEQIFCKQVIGYRAPNAYFATWMVKILEELDFKYDSSIAYNSFYNKTNVKLEKIPSFPYWLNKNNLSNEKPNTDLLELPWSYLKIRNLVFPGGGAFFFRLLGCNYFELLLNKNLKYGDTMFYFHPVDITTKKLPLNNFKKRPLYWINKGKKTEKELIKILKKYSDLFTTCEEIYLKNL